MDALRTPEDRFADLPGFPYDGQYVDAVGTLRNEPPEDLPPLQETVDAESLDALLVDLRSGGVDGEVSFEYVGYRVVLATDGDGRVFETGGRA